MNSNFGDTIEVGTAVISQYLWYSLLWIYYTPQDYSVLDLVGRGGFACVYRAKSKHNGQEVAIKMVRDPHTHTYHLPHTSYTYRTAHMNRLMNIALLSDWKKTSGSQFPRGYSCVQHVLYVGPPQHIDSCTPVGGWGKSKASFFK